MSEHIIEACVDAVPIREEHDRGDRSGLTMSGLGWIEYCERRAAYMHHNVEREAFPVRAQRAMRMGNVLEDEVVAWLATRDIQIADRQRLVTWNDVRGRIDGIASDLLIEIKSMSGFGWKKFKKALDKGESGLDESPFTSTYRYQVNGYLGGIREEESASPLQPTDGLVVAISRDSLEIACEPVDYDEAWMKDARVTVDRIRGSQSPEEFDRGAASGDLICRYCPYSKTCHGG